MNKKPILYIDQHCMYSHSKGAEIKYLSVSDSKTNKNWIVQYNTTLSEIIHYAIGYTEALDYSPTIYFSPNIDLTARPELVLNRMSEIEFQKYREAC